MKKTVSLVLCAVLLLMLCVPAFGAVIGEVLHSDIVAYINGRPVPSYNINGWTGIVAEDLRDYGFDVNWFPEERALYVTYRHENPNRQITADYVPESGKYPVGSHAMDVYATDIKTYVNGQEIEAFNVDGRTIIFIDWLQCYGDVVWNPAARTISYFDVMPWQANLYATDYAKELSEPVSSFNLESVKSEAGQFIGQGENADYLDYLKLSYSKDKGLVFSFSLYQRVLFQTEALHTLLREMLTVHYDGTETGKSADYANEHMKISINDSPIRIHKVEQGKGNGHVDYYFYLDCDITQDAIQTVAVTCN